VETLLDEAEVSSLETIVPVRKGRNFLIPPLDRPQIFTGDSGGRFPWSRCGNATR